MAPTNSPFRTLPLRYRLLLALLPAHVRDEHGREIQTDLSEQRLSTAALALDILRASPRAHWDVLRQDLTLAVRQMRRAPVFAIIAGLTLAIGIGGNVAFFTLVDGVVLQQLPFAGANRIVDITEEHLGRGMRAFGISPANFRDLAADTTLFQTSAAYTGRSATAQIGETRERVSFTTVTGDFFRVFSEAPLIGRTLAREDDVPGASDIVLSFAFWRRAFGSDPTAVGRQLEVDGRLLRIVGVMPDGFTFPNPNTAFWQPIGLPESEWQRRGARFVAAVARLRPGVSVEHAAAAMEVAGRALAAQHPKTNEGWSVLLQELRASQVSRVRTPLLLVWGAGALVLLIAVANVASLFLTRAVAREREVALRAALGARPGRILRQLATEGLLLTSLSAVTGFGIAHVVLIRIRPLATDFVPRMNEVAIGGRAVVYTCILALITTVLLSVLATSPVRGNRLWHSLGTSRASASRQRRQLQRGIVVAEVALAVFVLVGGALVIRTLVSVLSQPMGFEARDLLTFRMEPPWHADLEAPIERLLPALARDRRRASDGFDAVIERIRGLRGVRNAGAINRLPLTGDWWTTSVRLPEKAVIDDSDRIPTYVRPVTAGYFDAMGTRVIRGRPLLPQDVAGSERVVVIDAELARRIWPGVDPLGHELLLDGLPNTPRHLARVVGVVEAIHMNRLDAELRSTMYVPFSQALEGHYLNWGMDVVVQGATPQLETDIRRVVREVFPDAVVFRLSMMEDIIALSTADRRFQLLVLGFFGVLALLLSTIGVAGTLLLAVRERRGELAVRIALGARAGRLWWGIQRDGLALAGRGALLGVAGALAGAQAFSSLVYGVSVRDPLSLAAGPIMMLLAAFLAAAIPATRAVQVSPVTALRE